MLLLFMFLASFVIVKTVVAILDNNIGHSVPLRYQISLTIDCLHWVVKMPILLLNKIADMFIAALRVR